jgi:hypothetical protein
MFRTTRPNRGNLLTRTALGLALSLGVATGGLIAQPALAKSSAPKISYSPAYQKAAAALDKTLGEASKNADVQAAMQQVRTARQQKNDAAASAAIAQVEAALGGDFRAKLDAAAAVASTPGDKLKQGEMTRTYGVLIDDVGLQNAGLVLMLDSGAVGPEILGKVQWLAGVTAYQKHDYAAAAKYIQQAKDGGFTDPQLEAVLSDAYKRSNNPEAALANAQRDIEAARAAGTKPSETSIRTALQAAYDSKQKGAAIDLSVLLVQDYPSANAWNSAIHVVMAEGGYQQQEALDLLRLMARTNAFTDQRDYAEYLQILDARRFPGEALKVVDAGVASGKLPASSTVATEARATASSRVAADRASLPSLEKEARGGKASAAVVMGAADAFLSYGEAAKAEALYTIALTKPGIETERALTRLGIAQADQGKAAEAQATFAKIQGPRKALAQLWSAYAAQKASGGAAAAPAAS